MTDLSSLKARAIRTALGAIVPYSGVPSAAVVMLSDGLLVHGVAVESASFSLSIPALVNAVTTAMAAGRHDMVAVAMNRPITDAERLYLNEGTRGTWIFEKPSLLRISDEPPAPGADLNVFLPSVPAGPEEGIIAARRVSDHAFVPASDFPVGCVLVTDDGRAVGGVNVEHPDWSRILCAERNAVGTAVSYGVRRFARMYVSCPRDDTGSPCGACRQVIADVAPDVEIWMDRGDAPPSRYSPKELLPFAFSGRTLRP